MISGMGLTSGRFELGSSIDSTVPPLLTKAENLIRMSVLNSSKKVIDSQSRTVEI